MKLPRLKRVVVAPNKAHGSYIRIGKMGLIAVSSDAVIKLGIADGDRAVFLQDEDELCTWYFSFGKEGDYELRPNPSKPLEKTRAFTSRGLKEVLLQSLSLPADGSYRLWLSNDPLELEGKKLWRLNYRK